jgi:hypothetical protein
MATFSVPSVLNLLTLKPLPADGDGAIVEGRSAEGDGGAGIFWFQGSAFPKAISISRTTSPSVAIITTVDPANPNGPIIVTTATPHGFGTNQAVTITGVVGANNFLNDTCWLVVVPLAIDSKTFQLIDPQTGNLVVSKGSGLRARLSECRSRIWSAVP